MRSAGACIVLLLGLLLSPVFGADVLGYPFCDALRDSDSRAACLEYINAASSIGKWTSAVRWARFYRGSCEWLELQQRETEPWQCAFGTF